MMNYPMEPEKKTEMGGPYWECSKNLGSSVSNPIVTAHTDPGMVYFTYIWLISMVNVGKYTSPMDTMGYRFVVPAAFLHFKVVQESSWPKKVDGSLNVASKYSICHYIRRFTVPHRIHGTGIFIYIYHKNPTIHAGIYIYIIYIYIYIPVPWFRNGYQ